MPLTGYGALWCSNANTLKIGIGEFDTPEQLRLQMLEASPKLTSLQDIDKHIPQNCKIPPEQQAERQRLSDQAREKLQSHFLSPTISSHIVPSLTRWSTMISSYYFNHNQPEKIKEFETLFAKPESDKIQLERLTQQGKTPEQAQQALTQQKQLLAQQRGDFLWQMVEPFQGMSKDDFHNLSDQQVLDRFDDLVLIDTLAMEIKTTLSYQDEISLPDDKKQQLLKWNDLMRDTNVPMLQADFMMNPCYPLIDYQTMISTKKQALSDLQAIKDNPALQCYAKSGLQYYLYQAVNKEETLQQQLKEQGASEQHNQWTIIDKNENCSALGGCP